MTTSGAPLPVARSGAGRCATKKHNIYWVDATIVPFLDDDGNPYQYIGILTDITNSKRMAAKITASEQQYRSLVENVHEVIFQLDEQGHWVFLNPAWTEITGFQVHDCLGRNFLDYVYHEDIDKTFTTFQQLTNEEIHSHRSEQRFYDNRGNYCWFEVTLQSEIDPHSRSLIFTGTLNDITERRRIAQLQSEFISVVSHELRTPLTSIRGSLGLLEAGHGGPLAETQQKLVNIAHKNSQRLVALVNDILDMEKLMAGKMSLKSDQLNLVVLAEMAIEANAAYAHTYDVKFKLCRHPAEAIIHGDTDRLMQVMSNLLSNAAKYSPKDRPVEIDIINENGYTRVSVRDHGPGIPVEFRPRVFSAFAQADSSDTRQQGGTGLGLKISKTLVEKMGGRMGFDTELGVGTSFWFQLPLAGQGSSERLLQTAL
jgi:PAS domain S-box-containing protein